MGFIDRSHVGEVRVLVREMVVRDDDGEWIVDDHVWLNILNVTMVTESEHSISWHTVLEDGTPKRFEIPRSQILMIEETGYPCEPTSEETNLKTLNGDAVRALHRVGA